jgi:hypothetical protein
MHIPAYTQSNAMFPLSGKAATKTGRRAKQSHLYESASASRPVLVAALPR